MDLEEKKNILIDNLHNMNSCLVAFSGGLDSSYLAIMATRHVPGRVLCVTLDDPSTPRQDLESTEQLVEAHGIEHHIIHETELPGGVKENPSDRCYFCKSCLFERLSDIAKEEDISLVLDGENASDMDDNRPGQIAAREQGVVSPLLDAELTKTDIRELARLEGLSISDRPASACLSSRVPTGVSIEKDMLVRIDKTEDMIRAKGVKMVRARQERNGVRIELGPDDNTIENIELLKSMDQDLKRMGWSWVAVDLGGYVPAGLRGEEHGK